MKRKLKWSYYFMDKGTIHISVWHYPKGSGPYYSQEFYLKTKLYQQW